MPDWRKPMTQSYRYYMVSPLTWANDKELRNVKSCSIDWDVDTDTLCSASMEVEDMKQIKI